MTDFLLQVLWQTWNIFKQASLFLLFGFLLAGLLAVLVPEQLLARLFRKGKVRSVLWASGQKAYADRLVEPVLFHRLRHFTQLFWVKDLTGLELGRFNLTDRE